MVNQILLHISNTPLELIEYCQKKGIAVEAYSPIAHGEILHQPEIASMQILSTCTFPILPAPIIPTLTIFSSPFRVYNLFISIFLFSSVFIPLENLPVFFLDDFVCRLYFSSIILSFQK